MCAVAAQPPAPPPQPPSRAAGAAAGSAWSRPGGFASPTRHGIVGNCADAGCTDVGCGLQPLSPSSAWKGRRRSPPSSPQKAGGSGNGKRRGDEGRRFELRPYLQLVTADSEARQVALFLCSHLAVLVVELLLPGLWTLDAALLGAGLRGLLRSISLALALYAMVVAMRPPTATYPYGCALPELYFLSRSRQLA